MQKFTGENTCKENGGGRCQTVMWVKKSGAEGWAEAFQTVLF